MKGEGPHGMPLEEEATMVGGNRSRSSAVAKGSDASADESATTTRPNDENAVGDGVETTSLQPFVCLNSDILQKRELAAGEEEELVACGGLSPRSSSGVVGEAASLASPPSMVGRWS